MTKKEFLQLLNNASFQAYNFAKNYVRDYLPPDFSYSVSLNVSCDDPALKQFDIYPNDNGRKVAFLNEREVSDLLCRYNKVPVWIDISVTAVQYNKTIFALSFAGRYSDNENEFYYNSGGTGPFGIKSPKLPIDYQDGEKFWLKNG